MSKLLTKLGLSAILISTIGAFVVTESDSLKAQDTDSNETIENIAEEDTNLFGEQVTVRGQVSQVEPGMSFMLNEEGFLQGDDVLVLNVSGEMLPEMSEEELELQVTGELGRLILADVERDYGLTLDPDLYVDYADRPVIFAQSMTLSPNLGDITSRPEDFYGKEVAVEGEIDEIKSNETFTLDEDQLIGGEDLLVINVTGAPIPQEEENVVVTGMIRPFIQAEFERDYDLTWDLDFQEELEAEYSEKPVLVLDNIYPSAEDDGLFE